MIIPQQLHKQPVDQQDLQVVHQEEHLVEIAAYQNTIVDENTPSPENNNGERISLVKVKD